MRSLLNFKAFLLEKGEAFVFSLKLSDDLAEFRGDFLYIWPRKKALRMSR